MDNNENIQISVVSSDNSPTPDLILMAINKPKEWIVTYTKEISAESFNVLSSQGSLFSNACKFNGDDLKGLKLNSVSFSCEPIEVTDNE